MPVVGRDAELGEIERLVASVRDGGSGVVVVRGGAGIGKTTLLDAASAAASDLLVLRVAGVEAELALGFAGLHQLLMPLSEMFGVLPVPQASALEGAFGLGSTVPDRFFVALAALTLLSHAAADRGLLVVVDDAQWLDQESADALRFVARRIDADRIGLLWAVREPSLVGDSVGEFPTVWLGGLDDDAAASLLASVHGERIDPFVRDRLIADADGNPLALVELAGGLSRAQLAGLTPLPERRPITGAVEASFLRAVRALPALTQLLVLVAAADPTGNPVLLWRAGTVLGFDAAAAGPAVSAGLIQIDVAVSFRHPLLREVVYRGAAGGDRRRVHRALADATSADRDPDRRAMHLAEAALGPDEAVAGGLQRAAERAGDRGGYAASATLLERAAQLTPAPAQRAVRLLRAAQANFGAGALARARDQLAAAVPELDDEFLAAQARRMEGNLALVGVGRTASNDPSPLGGSDAAALLVEAAVAMSRFDLQMARDTFVDAFSAVSLLGSWSRLSLHDVASRMARTGPASTSAGAAADALHDGFADVFSDRYASAIPRLRAGLDGLRGDGAGAPDWHVMTMGVWASFAIGDYATARLLLDDVTRRARERGAVSYLAPAFFHLGCWELAVGTLAAADACCSQRRLLLDVRGLESGVDGPTLVVQAWRGREVDVRAGAPDALRRGERRGHGWTVSLARRALMLLELGQGNYDAAAAAVPSTGWDLDLISGPFNAADAVEALVRAGRLDDAHDHLGWLTDRAAGSGATVEAGLCHLSRAVLGDVDDVEGEFVAAISLLDGSAGRHHVGRAQLLFGEWLRRGRRRADARRELRLAYDLLSSAGADGFAERARLELLATGARARRRVAGPDVELTAQEQRVARLAAVGATNAEIAAELFISPYTVDHHLRNVFGKLGLTSRRQLARALG